MYLIASDKGVCIVSPSRGFDPLTKQLGAALRALRQSKNLNLEDLSRLSGVGIATLSHLENGNRDPKLSTIFRILRALRSDLRDLLFPLPPNEPSPSASAQGYKDLDL